MLNDYLIISGAVLTLIWGIVHVIPGKRVLGAIGKKNWESREILRMGWILEGITLLFIGTLVLLVKTYAENPDPVSHIVFRGCAAMLAAMAT